MSFCPKPGRAVTVALTLQGQFGNDFVVYSMREDADPPSRTDRSTQPSSDVPWYAEARRRAIATRDRHARRRVRKQQERAEEIDREARRQQEPAEELEREQQRRERQEQQELGETQERGVRQMLERFDFSFQLDTGYLDSSRTSSIVVQSPASRAHSPQPEVRQRRDRRSDAPRPEAREMAGHSSGAQERQPGTDGGDDTGHPDCSERAWINYVRSCRPANWRNSLIRY